MSIWEIILEIIGTLLLLVVVFFVLLGMDLDEFVAVTVRIASIILAILAIIVIYNFIRLR